MKVVKRVIVGVLVVALAAGGIYTGLVHVKKNKVTDKCQQPYDRLVFGNNAGWNHHHKCFSEYKHG